MEGMSLQQFIDNLYYGTEMIFIYKNRKYMIGGDVEQSNFYLKLDEIPFDDENCDFTDYYSLVFKGRSFEYCAKKFLKTKIIDDKDIYEIEKEIKVLFG